MVGDGYLQELSSDECQALLRSTHVARLAFVAPEGIVVLPVAYELDGPRTLVFATSGTSLLADLQPGTSVTVQIDDIAEDLANGWSVLGHGQVTNYQGQARPQPWAPGHSDRLVAITVDRLTGRAVSADQ